jgi:hypothetical protein
MASYVSGTVSLSGVPDGTLTTVELRVISNLLQREMGNMQQDELRILRNDQAFELGVNPPVIPGN